MQKNFLFFLLSSLLFCSIDAFSIEKQSLKEADSLFVIGQFQVAKETYLSYSNQEKFVHPTILLKLAYIFEKEGDYTQSLYYLSRAVKQEPSVALYEKMATLGETHRLSGYEFDDFTYFVIYFKRYGYLIYFVLVVFGIYILRIMYVKRKAQERIRPVHRWFFASYLVALLFVFNALELLRYGIIKHDPTFLRSYPSSASTAIEVYNKGHKVPVLLSIDHWRLVWWDNKFVYLREDALLLL